MSATPLGTGLTIGIRDSGVGGLTVARRVLDTLPGASLLYFADTAHVPYGDKTPAQIRHYALSISEFLLREGAGAVVFACNTTSAYALDLARERLDAPFFGVIEPGSRQAAAISSGRVGVLATAATVESGVYTRSLLSFEPRLLVKEVACPAFVPLVEAQEAEGIEALEACKHYMAPLLRLGVDTVVLGCTHYPLLLPLLQRVAPSVRFVDPADGVADDLMAAVMARRIPGKPSLATQAPRHRFFVSGPEEGVDAWIHSLLQLPRPALERGPVFDPVTTPQQPAHAHY